MPSLLAGNITYQDARSAILREFGSTVCIIEVKDLFSDIEFKTNETLSEFANQFYHKAQVLLGAGVMVEHNAKLAMKNAVNPYQELYWAMSLFLGQEFTMVQMLDYLCCLEAAHNAPNKKSPDITTLPTLAHWQLEVPRRAKLRRDKFLSQISLATAVKIRGIMPQNALMDRRYMWSTSLPKSREKTKLSRRGIFY
ncbi:hypothetical protein DSO57_1003815 [Entomophthora muscae]|uniref:Uncharacterized protein n=1 Tax=Entomophthora muscae TaxID=34485 RepID=A0ACC2UI98_9FUNG|nr:hypothetical protein DSO57_1003815 [Entomophthora muscae]